MKYARPIRLFTILFTIGACSWLASGSSWAQKKKAPPPPPTTGPTIGPISVGVQPGQTADIVLTGTSLANTTGASLNVPAKITIPTDAKNGQDAGKVKVRVEIPKGTPIGWYAFRLATLSGVSNVRVFCVDDLPQIVSTNNNRNRTSAQAMPIPSAVSGTLAAEQGDAYKFTVKAGQRLSFDCQARRIGSAIDAQMSIYDAKSQRELAYDNDSPGCQTDPRITYTFKEAGDYLLEVKDVLNRGGADYFYRVRVGDFPLATTPIPLAVQRGTKTKVGFAGPVVEGAAPVEVNVPTDSTAEVVWVAPKSATGLHGWPVPLAVSDVPEATELEPNDDPKKPNRIVVPGGVSGLLQANDDLDNYVFKAKKGQKLVVEAHTLEWNSPSLVYMIVKNGKTLADIAKSNPQAPPPGDQRFEFTPTEDTDYVLEVQHLSRGGPSESYRVTIRPPVSGFEVNLLNDRFEAAPGNSAALPVQIVRKGYAGPIELSIQGQPALTGAATLKAGQNAGILMIAAKGDAALGAYQFQVIGKAAIDGKAVQQAANAKAVVVQSLNGVLYPPMNLPTFQAFAVTEKAPFSLAIKMDPPEAVPGGKAKVTITAKRDAGFTEAITLTAPSGLPATIPVPKITPIPKDKNEVSFALDVNVKTAMGEYFVLMAARANQNTKSYAASVPPLVLSVGLPFDLKVEPAVASLKPGEKTKLKITAKRKGGYAGPITLAVRKLPAGVTAAAATLAADKTTTEIELSAAATAKAADTAIDVAGTATALNNLQNASPAIMVRVQKK